MREKEIRKIETNIAIKEDHAKGVEKKQIQIEAKIRGNANIFERLRNQLEQHKNQIAQLDKKMDEAKARHTHIPLRMTTMPPPPGISRDRIRIRSRVGPRRGDGLLGLTNDLGFSHVPLAMFVLSILGSLWVCCNK